MVFCLDLYCQNSININTYNRGVLTTSLNGADASKTPIKNIKTNVGRWLYLEITDPKNVDYIELTFLERVFNSTQFVIGINNNIDTITIDKRHWLIEIQDTLKTFRINEINNSYGSTIDSIKFLTNGSELEPIFIHKRTIDNSSVANYHDEMEDRLKESKSVEYRITEKLYKQHFRMLLNQEKRSGFKKMISEYHKDPRHELYKLVISAGDESNGLASNYISGNKYSKWSKVKRIRKGKREYLRSAKLYRKALLLDCSKDNSLTYKAVAAYNQAENFNEAEELLKPLIDRSQFDYKFFNYYFMTKKKVSKVKELRENGFFYYGCGGSPDVIDSEYYYTDIILKNAALLYKEKEFWLLINYLKQSNIRINWSDDIRLNQLNTVICQMLIESLIKQYSISELLNEFKSAEIYTIENDYYCIGGDGNYPNSTMKLFDVPLKIYFTNPRLFSKVKNTKPIIEYNEDKDEMKRKTIIYELLK